MANRGDITQFTMVDAQADPRYFITFLDVGSTVEGIQGVKRESLIQLDLETGHRVLDVGCGTGEDVRTLAHVVGGQGRAVGVDVSGVMIAEAVRRHSDCGLPVTFTVDGMSALEPAESGGAVVGSRFEEANGRIENVSVINIRNGDGSAQGLAIQVQGVRTGAFDPGMPPPTKRVEITGNTILFTDIGVPVQVLGRFFGDPQCGTSLQPSRNNGVHHNDISNVVVAGIQLESFDLEVGVPTENRFEGNMILGQSPDAFGIVVLQANQNTFVDNLVNEPINTAVVDQTVGSGTASTANTYINNQCADSEPAGLCSNPALTTVAGAVPQRAETRSAQRPIARPLSRSPAPYIAKR